MPLMRRHDGDGLVGRDPLRHVHVETIGKVEPRQHRIALREPQLLPIRHLHYVRAALDLRDSGQGRIEQAARLVVGGPADAIAFPQRERLLLGELQAVALFGRGQFERIEAYPSSPIGELDLAAANYPVDVVAPRRDANIPRTAGAHFKGLAGAVGRDMSQLLAGRVNPLINGDLTSLALHAPFGDQTVLRSEEHTSELQSLMRISYAALCLKKKI